MADILIISPHLDDAVLSLGSFIWQHTQQGKSVKVITVFSSGNRESNHKERQQNDILALRQLNASYEHLNFIDAPFRHTAYNSFSSIMFNHQKTQNTKLHKQISEVLQQYIVNEKPKHCFFPLGIGGHVDHNLIFHIGYGLAQLNLTECLFYEEYPYNLVKNWSNIRFAKLFGITPFRTEEHKGLKLHPYPFLQNYITNKLDLEQSEEFFKQEFNISKTTPLGNELQFLGITVPVQENIKQEALSKYTTEFETLFGNQINKMLSDEFYWKLS